MIEFKKAILERNEEDLIDHLWAFDLERKRTGITPPSLPKLLKKILTQNWNDSYILFESLDLLDVTCAPTSYHFLVESPTAMETIMKRSRFTEEQIIAILKEQENGLPTKDVCRKAGISSAIAFRSRGKP